ncbi:hypothetical protein JCM5296_007126 [Sporobolomyces johnsonii]
MALSGWMGPSKLTETEADAFHFFTSRRDKALDLGVVSSDWQQEPIRPNAPWLTFLRARDALLGAFHAFDKSTLDDGKTELEKRTGRAFVAFSLALDAITVPQLYWSDLPHEDVPDAESHAQVLRLLDELTTTMQAVAHGRTEEEGEPALEVLTERLFDGSYPRPPLLSPPIVARDRASSDLSVT